MVHRRLSAVLAALSLTALAGLSIPGPALALSPPASAFVRALGLDPDSDAVRVADADGDIEGQVMGDPETFSLERLVRENRPTAVRQFIATRWFVHQLKADFAHTPLIRDGYNSAFLTAEERQLVGRKVAMSLLDP